ncbi:MAG: SUMF1/EgtB/PvdO family nonheme iron enzyme [Acidobacteria bacterium]|nr:SUMF1/EgtB/PvdO family nonheme iron enzyme [Acidobacteriota bacterium]
MMQAFLWLVLVVFASLCTAIPAAAQAPVGALAIDERQGDQWGWAVDYETAAAAQARALSECGPGCSVVLTFGRCAAYAADQDADSTVVGGAEAYASGPAAQQVAVSECRSRGGGSGCIVRAWGCNRPVVEEGLNLDRAVRRQIQHGLQASGFDPGGADGFFGPRTRAAIREWQSSRGERPTGYLDEAAAAALRSASGSEPVVAGTQLPPPRVNAPQQPSPASTPELEGLFWQSIMNSTNAADFEAYLRRFPNGLFSELAQNRLTALRLPGGAPAGPGSRIGDAGSPTSGSRLSGADAPKAGTASAGDVRRRPGEVFRDCAECPEMVVLPDGRSAMSRYEVTVGEFQAFTSATGDIRAPPCDTIGDGDWWTNPGFFQTIRNPVTCVHYWHAQNYAAWLSRTTGARYRLPTEREWARAAVGAEPGCHYGRTGNIGTCPVGSYGANAAGLSDMVGNVWEWTNCREGDCDHPVIRGGSWNSITEDLHPGARVGFEPHNVMFDDRGIRVLRELD